MTLDTVVTFIINSGVYEMDGKKAIRDLCERDVTSLFNQADFYSVGKGVFCFVDDMTDDERNNTAAKLDSSGHRMINKAEKIAGQGYINPETMEVEFPEPVVIGE